MSQLPPAKQSPQATPPASEPGFELALHEFWIKNRQAILLVIAAALLGIVGREGWQYFAEQREQGVQEEYARIADQPAKLAAFAEANASHPLAGVAYLRLADEKYLAVDYPAAATYYQKAAGSLKNEALLGRARLGSAMCLLNGGDRIAGEAALKTLKADPTLHKGVRAEAAYQLASLAAETGNTEEVKKLTDEVNTIDAAGPWAQRATMLYASLTATAKPAGVVDPGLTFKPTGK
jgi:hypothetical protein